MATAVFRIWRGERGQGVGEGPILLAVLAGEARQVGPKIARAAGTKRPPAR